MSSVVRRIARQRGYGRPPAGLENYGDWPERHKASFARSKAPRWNFQNGSAISMADLNEAISSAERLGGGTVVYVTPNSFGVIELQAAFERARERMLRPSRHEPASEPTGDASPDRDAEGP